MKKLLNRLLTFIAAEARFPVWFGTTEIKRPAAHLCDWRCWTSCQLGDHVRSSVTAKCRCCRTKTHSYEMEAAYAIAYTDLTTEWWNAEPWAPPLVTAEMRTAYEAQRVTQ